MVATSLGLLNAHCYPVQALEHIRSDCSLHLMTEDSHTYKEDKVIYSTVQDMTIAILVCSFLVPLLASYLAPIPLKARFVRVFTRDPDR